MASSWRYLTGGIFIGLGVYSVARD